MRYIEKTESPPSFEAWKNLADENWKPTYRDLRNPQKKQVHESLLAEQGGMCCYCGKEIDLTDSHIEHLIPQEQQAELALAYCNLHASCIREQSPDLPMHCGHAKGRDLDAARHVSPLDPACEQRFLYSLDGPIRAAEADDHAASYMIDLLKLDNPSLQNGRREVLAGAFTDEFLGSATEEELLALRRATRRRNGRLRSFAHVVARYVEQLVPS